MTELPSGTERGVSGVLAVRARRGFDGERVRRDGVVVLVDDGRIVGVEDGHATPPSGWRVLDFGDATVLPGLIDVHVHLCGDSEMGALDRVAGYSDDELDAVIERGLRAQLAAGVTTVRDLGDRHWSVVAWRDRQRVGDLGFACPTIVASGPPLTSPGGHCWYMGGEVSSAEHLVAAVRERADRHTDVVKVMTSGGLTTLGTDVMTCQFTTDELRVIVEESHRVGLPVVSHAHGLPAVEQSVEAGVDGIEHCTCMTESGIQLSDRLLAALAASQIAVCPTLGRTAGWTPPPIETQTPQAQHARRLAERIGMTPEARRQDARRMHLAGVRLISGADSGIGDFKPHGVLSMSITEFVLGGIPTVDALASATSRAAEVCGLSDRKGRLGEGYDADLVVVEGDPFTDVSALGHVLAVVVHGQAVDETANGGTPT
jgi:imidazolonepropionase-like amidohydrolase